MHEAGEAALETGSEQVDRPEHVDLEHPVHIRLRRIGTVRGRVEDQVRFDGADKPANCTGVDEIRFLDVGVLGNSVEPPAIALRTDDEVNLVTVPAKPARNVRADEPARAGDERLAFSQQSP